ncbi:autotransporter assembly complex protein TamB [Vibrio hippocampi]|nr:translocation/assembly module TamB domain-containing protein [Vibrio hippocampi]
MLKAWQVTKWTSITLVTILLLVVLLIAFALFSNAGLKSVLWGAQQVLPQLQVTNATGALFPRFTLEQLSYKDDELFIDLQAESITLAIDLHCLTQPKLCVDEIALQGVRFAMPEVAASESTSPESEPISESTTVSTPLPIEIRAIDLSDIELSILGNDIRWQRFATSLAMSGSELTIGKTQLEDPLVKLATADDSSPEPETSKESSSAPIVLPEVEIPLTIKVEGIEIVRFKLEQETPVVVNALSLVADASDYQVNVDALNLDMPQVDASLQGGIELKGGYPLKLALQAAMKQTELKGQKLDLNVSGSVESLNLQSEFSGLLLGKLQGKLEPLNSKLPFDATLSDVSVQWPLTGESEYQASITQLSASGSLDGYKVSLQGKALGQPIPDVALELEGSGDLQHIELAQLSVKGLGGSVDGKVMVDWQSPINWDGDINLTHIQPGLQWPEAEGDLSGRIVTNGSLTEAGGWQVAVPTLDIVGVLRDYPLDIDGEVIASDKQGQGELHIETQGLNIAHGPNKISASGSLDKNWDMALQLDFPDLSKSVPDLAGQLSGDLSLKGAMLAPDVDVNLGIQQVNWKQEAGLQQLKLVGQLAPLPLAQAKADIELTAKGLRYQEQSVESLDVTFIGTQAAHTLKLAMISELLSANLEVDGQLQLKPAMAWLGNLNQARFETEQGPIELDKAVDINVDIDKQLAKVSAHCWKQGGSSLCLDKDAELGQSGEAYVSINQFNFEQIKDYIPNDTEIAGLVNAKAWAKWAPESKPEASVKVEMPKGNVTQSLEVPLVVGWEKVEVDAKLTNDKLQAKWLIDVTDNGDLLGNIELPDVLSEQRKIDGQIELTRFNLDFLQPLFGEFNQVKANIDSKIDIKGDAMHPQLFGDFHISDLLLTGDISPVQVSSGEVVLAFDGYEAKLDANIQTKDGELKVDGEGNWQDLAQWQSKVRIFSDALNVDVPPMVKVKVVPDMEIVAGPQFAKIDGSIGLPWGRIVVEELPQSAVAVSSDQVLLNSDLTPEDERSSLPFNVETNILIDIGNDFTISAFGLEGDLRGNLKVTQKDKGPFVQGEINIVDGSYSSFGQDLIIEEGKILMTGPVDQPYVNITAIRNPDTTADDVEAGVKVTGLATEPKVEIFSDPSMPQANALSYLLRGQDIDGETGGNALTTTLIGLSLARSGKVVGEIGQAFGVKDLQLDTAGTGDDSQVTVSGYVLPGLQVKYGVGIFNSLGEFTVRYRIIEDFYVEAVSGLYSSVIFLYQFEVD